MRIHIIHAHSERDSFVAAMRDVLRQTFSEAGAEVIQSDLYAMGFNPVMSSADFGERKAVDHLTYAMEQRHGFANRTLAPDILAEVDKVLSADLLVFTFPLQWFGVPAILKGWIERVFLSGPFYGGKRVYERGGLAGKRAFAAFSLGGRDHMFGPDALHGELTMGMMRHFFQGTLGYVGLEVLEPFIAYHVPYVAEPDRQALLGDLAEVARTLKERPVLPMPDLSKFDDTFAPRPPPRKTHVEETTP
ncbi:NAD(P)H-dependent oxidoreductase [Rhodospirillum sp. A1_3_36]|uniref:NAD(P)H-dependent oxidoreductase n=1 Tax=Rhodospirillum sp. A1_3_36 TaxID=3391666 RepID=UPI0039A48E22